MSGTELAPWLVRAVAAACGALTGVGGAVLADVLPPHYGLAPLAATAPTGRRRRVRNKLLVVLGAALALALAELHLGGPEAPGALVELGTGIVLGVALLAAAAIDLEHMILPDEITLVGAAFGLATSPFRGATLVDALVGAGVGLVAAYLPAFLFRVIRGKTGVGAGDSKLLVLFGAWLGWRGVLFALFAGAAQSLVAAAVMSATKLSYRVPESVVAQIDRLRARAAEGDAEAKELLEGDPLAEDVGRGILAMRLPFGPFLVLGALEARLAPRVVADVFAWILGG